MDFATRVIGSEGATLLRFGRGMLVFDVEVEKTFADNTQVDKLECLEVTAHREDDI